MARAMTRRSRPRLIAAASFALLAAEAAIANRERSGVELAVVLVAAIFGALGVLLVVRAERFRGATPA